MQKTSGLSFESRRYMQMVKEMNDEELLNRYNDIKQETNSRCIYCLNEICARNLLNKLG